MQIKKPRQDTIFVPVYPADFSPVTEGRQVASETVEISIMHKNNFAESIFLTKMQEHLYKKSRKCYSVHVLWRVNPGSLLEKRAPFSFVLIPMRTK